MLYRLLEMELVVDQPVLGCLIGDRGGGGGWIMVKLNYMQTRQSAEFEDSYMKCMRVLCDRV